MAARAWLWAMLGLLAANLAQAQAPVLGNRPGDFSSPVLLAADEVTYDQEAGIVSASGNVELAQGERVLLADRVSYSVADSIVTASGNVSLLEPSGEVLFAEFVELDSALSTGFIENLRLLLSDDSRFAANEARRDANERTELSRAVYSPCEICIGRALAPLWQLKAVKIVHDGRKREIRYQDAVLEVFGLPVAYTPFFRHADPSVRRQSGFLAPNFGQSSTLGATVQVPYFFNLAPERDLTLEPIFTSKEGVVLAGEYRSLTRDGRYRFEGSITQADRRDDNGDRLDEREIRGHIRGDGRFEIDQYRRWGFNLARSTDDTYLKRYRLGGGENLVSSLFAQDIRGRNFAGATAYAFQGLRQDDDPGLTPLVLPLLEYSYSSEPRWAGSLLRFDASAVALHRSESTDTRRITLEGGWQLPYVTSAGEVITLTASLRGDGYWVNGPVDPSRPDDPAENGVSGRVVPRLVADWRYPLAATAGTSMPVIEPIVQAVLAPYTGSGPDIPNEDSQTLEFDDTNLFGLNRFPGFDRIESGPRLNVGVKNSVYTETGGYYSVLLGQVLRAKADDSFGPTTGLDDERSDYVARIVLSPAPFLDLTERVRFDRDDLSLRRHEIYATVGPRWLRLQALYVQLDRELTPDGLAAREEVALLGRAQLTPYWAALAESRRDLTEDGGAIRNGVSFEYLDECIGVLFGVRRDFTRDRDLEPSTSYGFRVVFRNLG
ncbi:MAG: LPS-assembly protein LptD [Alphaproteobacteria bacterium]|nr:LPS-assembly protein LptD [Alphaproteobacteria bacterium]